jgi:cell division protease FtsH
MSEKVGNISFYDSSGQSDFGFTKPYSEKTAEVIDQEVKQIIEESYLRAQEVLKDHMKGLTELAELLLEKEVIFAEDLERIFGKRKAELIKEAKEAKTKAIAEKNADSKQVVSDNSDSKTKNESKQKELPVTNSSSGNPVKKSKKKE